MISDEVASLQRLAEGLAPGPAGGGERIEARAKGGGVANNGIGEVLSLARSQRDVEGGCLETAVPYRFPRPLVGAGRHVGYI